MSKPSKPIVYFLVFLVVGLMFGVSHASSQSFASLPSGSSGAGVAYINITDTLTQSSQTSASVGVTELLRYNASGTINFTILNANDISLVLNGTQYKFDRILSPTCNVFTQEAINCTTILLHNVTAADNFILSYNYNLKYPSNSNNMFNYTFVFIPFSPTQLTVKTVLPQGAFLPNGTYVNPKNAFFSSNGKSISATWSIFQVTSAPIPLPFSVSYELGLNQTTPTSSPIVDNYVAAIIIIVAIIILFWIVFLAKRKKPKKQKTVSKVRNRNNPLLKVLNDSERKVLNMLKKDAFVTQKELINKTGYSKAKMSKIMSKLVRLRLVRVKPDGRTNKIKRI